MNLLSAKSKSLVLASRVNADVGGVNTCVPVIVCVV